MIETILANGELYKPISGFEGRYSITTLGRVIAHAKVFPRGRKLPYFRVLSQDKDGYSIICLKKDGKPTMRKVHRLVAEAFIENIDGRPEVNHENGIKNDNNVINLSWTTSSENAKHKWKNGLQVASKKQRDAARKSINDYRRSKKNASIN